MIDLMPRLQAFKPTGEAAQYALLRQSVQGKLHDVTVSQPCGKCFVSIQTCREVERQVLQD